MNDWKLFTDFFKKIDGYKEKDKLIENKNKLKRKCPSKKSNNYDVGFILKSEYDNKDYIVKLTKNGIKRWSTYKE